MQRGLSLLRHAWALGVLSPWLVGCSIVNGSGVIEEDTIQVDTSGVKELVVCCGFEVRAALGTKDEVTVRTDDNLIDEVVVDVVGDRLELRWRDDQAIYEPSRGVRFELEVPELERLETSGGAMVEFGVVEGDELKVEQSGGGETRFERLAVTELEVQTSGGGHFEALDLRADRVRLESSGGGSTELGGICAEFSADVSGGGSLEAEDFETETTELSLTGGGSASLTVTERLSGDASGGSSVSVRGGAEVDLALSGGSTVDED